MEKRTKLIAGGAAALAALGAGAGVGVAAGGGDDKPLTGRNYERATAAALEHVGGGSVVDTETGDDGAAYEVEIRRDDGRVIEVQLDDGFRVMGSTADDEGPDDAEERDD